MEYVVGVALAAIIIYALGAPHRSRKRRRQFLLDKYDNEEVVDAIMAQKVWQGMTAEMLFDSWGQPAGMDERVFKSKVSRTYKYNPTGRNQFKDRVKTENGIVVGWRQR